MGTLTNKIALITGGTSGIGEAAARLFRDAGATVTVTGTSDRAGAADAADHDIDRVVSDVSRIGDIETLMERIKSRHGRLDVLFANAGIPGARRAIEEVDPATFDHIIGINLRGLFYTVAKALPLMGAGGSIILTASVAAHTGLPHSSVYAASKAAVRSLGRSFAAELMERRIRVNTLTPGLIHTALMDKFDIPAEQMIERLRGMVPMGRVGQAIEAAQAALFLASEDSSFMTGTEIRVAGGQTDI